jgi:mannan endo-1,4-beta-mannosidase
MRLSALNSGLVLLALALISAATQSAYPRTNGLKFEIDGKSQYLTGTNAYWLPFLMDNADIDLALDHIAGAGMKILRTWGFNDVNRVPNKGIYSAATINTKNQCTC